MRIMSVNIPDDDYWKIKSWIACDRAENWSDEEWHFYNPTEIFILRMRLMGYPVAVGELDD